MSQPVTGFRKIAPPRRERKSKVQRATARAPTRRSEGSPDGYVAGVSSRRAGLPSSLASGSFSGGKNGMVTDLLRNPQQPLCFIDNSAHHRVDRRELCMEYDEGPDRGCVSLTGCDPTPQSFSCQGRQSDFRRAGFLSVLGYNTWSEGIDQRSVTLVPSRFGTRCYPWILTTSKPSSEREGLADVLSRRCGLARYTRQRRGGRIFRLSSVCRENPAVQWCRGLRTDIVRIA
jgi:hypothetical protein